jgi:predicted permease
MASTPTAANTTVYAIQFQTEPQNVLSATLISTIMSIATLPIVIYLAMYSQVYLLFSYLSMEGRGVSIN